MRGGRGRGRFGGRGSFTQDIIRDNLEDLGIDAFQRLEEIIPPQYPPIPIPAPSSLSEGDLYQIQKMREISFSTQQNNLLEIIKANSDGVASSIPFELLKGSVSGNEGINRKGVDVWKRLESEEASGVKSGEKKQDNESSDGEANSNAEDEYDIGDDDYAVDHYASDDGEDAGGGAGDEAFY